MEEGLQGLREKTHQHLEQFWDTMQLKMGDLRHELMAEIAKLLSPPFLLVTTHQVPENLHLFRH